MFFPITISVVVLDFSFDGFSNNRDGVWRLNTALSADHEFKREISVLLLIAKRVLLPTWWDDLKLVIRSACINYCTRKCQSVNRERNFLTKHLIRAKMLSMLVTILSFPNCEMLKARFRLLFLVRRRALKFDRVPSGSRKEKSPRGMSNSVRRKIRLILLLTLMVAKKRRRLILSGFLRIFIVICMPKILLFTCRSKPI